MFAPSDNERGQASADDPAVQGDASLVEHEDADGILTVEGPVVQDVDEARSDQSPTDRPGGEIEDGLFELGAVTRQTNAKADGKCYAERGKEPVPGESKRA